jgi:hypothetical protein
MRFRRLAPGKNWFISGVLLKTGSFFLKGGDNQRSAAKWILGDNQLNVACVSRLSTK